VAKRALGYGMPDELRTRCLGMLCELHHYRMDLQRDALPYAEEVLRIAPRGTEPWNQGLAAKLVCSIQAGNLEEFEALIGIAGATTPAPGAVRTWTLCLAIGVLLLDLVGRARVATPLLQGVGPVAAAAGDEPIAAAIFHAVSAFRLAYAEEEPRQGLEHAEAFRRIAEATGHKLFCENAKLYIGMNRGYVGAGAVAERMLVEVAPIGEVGLTSAHRAFLLAWLAADRGALDEARRWAAELIEAGRARGLSADEGRGQWVLAEVLRRAGELDGADVAIAAGLATLRAAAPLDVPGVLATLAALRRAQGRIAEARAAAEEGLASYESMAACGFFRAGFLRLVHAECLEAAGDHEAAKAAITAARARLFAIAAKIGDAEDRRCFLEEVVENRRTLELARRWVGPDEPAR
jgi:hypothetical protein